MGTPAIPSGTSGISSVQSNLTVGGSGSAEKKADGSAYATSTLQSADAAGPRLELPDPMAFLRLQLSPQSQFFNALGQDQILDLPEGRYVGKVSDGKPHGRGVLTYHSNDANGRSKYEGTFVQGRREGRGVLTWTNGNKYDGYWENDKFNGDGEWSSSVCTYRGKFLNGKFHGLGVRINADGSRIEGAFENDLAHGKAKRISADGTVVYIGNFEKGFQSGYGELTGPGISYKGQWKQGKYDGEGTYVYGQGRYLRTGVFKNGEHWDGTLTDTSNAVAIRTFKAGKEVFKCVIL